MLGQLRNNALYLPYRHFFGGTYVEKLKNFVFQINSAKYKKKLLDKVVCLKSIYKF